MSVCVFLRAIGCSFFLEVFFTSPQIWGGVCVCGGGLGGCHVSCVTCHMSHVTCHMSCVMCHVSHVMCHMHFFFSDKVAKLIGGGSVINRAYPV